MKRHLLALGTAAGILLVGAVGTPTASAHERESRPTSVSIAGAVSTPLSYSAAQLATLTQTTLPDLRTRADGDQVTGVLLQPLIAASGPVLPAVKNAALRVTLRIGGRGNDAISVALAELDPNNGNHPALLVANRGRHARGGDAVDLVFPGDRGSARTVRRVDTITVTVVAPALPTDVAPGALRLVTGERSVTLSAATLAALPSQTRTVAFRSGQGPQTRIETGPTLAAVLRAARIRTHATTTVAAIADDGYVATVTPAEATSGRRPLLLSLIEDEVALERPRLITDGDVFGGRYVSGVVALDISGDCRR